MNSISKGLEEKPINPKSKGYGNMGQGSPKDLAKAHGNDELEWAEGAQGNEMGQGSLEAMEWAKEAQNSINISPMIILGHWN